MADTLPLASKIQQTSSRSIDHNIITAGYGDGFEQTAEFGANAKKDMWDVRWSGLTEAERNTLVAAFDLTTVFNWTPFGEVVEKNFKMTGQYKETITGDRYSISLKLKQVYVL
jgi:phage-related protein